MKDNIDEKKRFATVMYGLSEDFGGNISKNSLAVRFEALKEYSIDQISTAATWLLKNREKDFPSVPATREIISAIEKISGSIESKTAANLECDKVLKNLKFFGRECKTVFKDPITKYLMENRWSFWQLGNMQEDDLKWFRRDFIEAYNGISVDFVALENNCSDKKMIPAGELKKLITFNKDKK